MYMPDTVAATLLAYAGLKRLEMAQVATSILDQNVRSLRCDEPRTSYPPTHALTLIPARNPCGVMPLSVRTMETRDGGKLCVLFCREG